MRLPHTLSGAALGLALLLISPACTAPAPEGMADEPRSEEPPANAAESAAVATAQEPRREDLPKGMQPCFGCHRQAVVEFLDHGMAASVGPAGRPPPGEITNPRSGTRYELLSEPGGAWLVATAADGGVRRQRVVARLGGGVFDTSWVTAEVDPFTGLVTDRLFFAPVETVTGHGLELSPFELHEGSAGVDFALTQDCLTCHTTNRVAELPAASTPGGPYPTHALGAEAFGESLRPIGCDACHGSAERHLKIMIGLDEPGSEGDIGIARLGELPAASQRDVCARCHLQGDARLELVEEPDPRRPLAGQIPVLVPATALDDFRFVSQTERLAESACFQGSPEMTCGTCHAPHRGAAEQGVAAFDAACTACHGGEEACTRPPELRVEDVLGEPARSEAGCADCHVRRSQPFDLPHVRSADHFIRRRIPPPADDVPHRSYADPDGTLELFHDERLAAALSAPGGRRWLAGVEAVGLASQRRAAEALERFAAFPPPGSPEARTPSAPEPLVSFESLAMFHHARGAALASASRFEEALAAFGDALALDPDRAETRLTRARLRLDTGNPQGALEDTEVLIRAHPYAEAPWNLRSGMALALGRPELAVAALEASVERWPSDAGAWHTLGRLLERMGRLEEAQEAFANASVLAPSRGSASPPPSPAAVR